MESDSAESKLDSTCIESTSDPAAKIERKFVDLLNPALVCSQPDDTNLVGQVKRLITDLTGLDPPHNMDAFMFCKLFGNLFGDTVHMFVRNVFGIDFPHKARYAYRRYFHVVHHSLSRDCACPDDAR